MASELPPNERQLKQAEEALEQLSKETRRREQILDSILSATSDFAYIFDQEGRFIFANQALLDLWGISLDAAVGRNFFDLGYPEELASRLQAQVREVFEKKQRIKDETSYTSPAGVEGYYEYIFSPVVEFDGSVAFVVGSTRDISDRKRSQQEMERMVLRLREAQRIGQIGDWERDMVTGVISWSPQVFEILGRDPALGPPRDFEETKAIFDGPSQSKMVAGIALAIETGEAQTYELAARQPDGGRIYVESTVAPRKDEEGNVIGLYGTMRNITERKLTDETLLQRNELLDLADDAIMVRNAEGRIQFWNRGAQSIYGWTSDEAVGKVAAKLLYIDSERHDLAKKCLLETGSWSGELRQMRKDGTPVIVASRWTLLSDRDGTPRSMLVINTDITEQKRVEAQFLRAQRLESIGTLASGVAHDLNNILAPILLSVPLLREDLPPEARENILSDLEASAQRGSEIVKQVLTFARGAEGDRLLIQPTHLIKEMANIARQSFPKTIQISTHYPEDAWSIEADPTQLHQVLMNLCVNARDAMPGGGELTIDLENILIDDAFAATMPRAKAGPHIVVRVSDTGKGIPQNIIDQIFDPFFTTKELGKGTGLGLSTCLGIVKGHGGFINVYSEADLGTTFRVFLPAVRVSGGGASKAEAEAEPYAAANGQLLLLVDDEQSIRNMASAVLVKHGYKVVVAADGFEAITMFAERMYEIDAVITDITMPLMDGIMLIRTLRQMKPALRVIASTGQGDYKRRKELDSLNVPVCLNKPYNKENLLIAVGEALAQAPR